MKNGGEYKGNFHKGKFNGHGVFKWKNGSSYEGEWFNEKKHGKGRRLTTGRYVYDNGDIYEGDFSNDVQNGFGTLMKENGLQLQRLVNKFLEGRQTLFDGDQDRRRFCRACHLVNDLCFI